MDLVPCIQVWDCQRKTVLTDFKKHSYGVQCCALSPDETLVLSADIDSVVMVSTDHTQ